VLEARWAQARYTRQQGEFDSEKLPGDVGNTGLLAQWITEDFKNSITRYTLRNSGSDPL
jgi:hypothetical protein